MQEGTNFAGKITILPENCHFARKSAISALVQVQKVSSVCHMQTLFKFAFLGKFLEYDRIVREILLL